MESPSPAGIWRRVNTPVLRPGLRSRQDSRPGAPQRLRLRCPEKVFGRSESPQATGFRPAWPLLLSGPGAHVLAGSQTRSPAGGSLSRSSRGGGGSQRPGSPAGPPSPGSGCRGTQVGVAAARPPPGRPQLYH